MTWFEVAHKFDAGLTLEEFNDILWNETAFPFGDIRYNLGMLRGAIRARKNSIHRCELCFNKRPYHSTKCLANPTRSKP